MAHSILKQFDLTGQTALVVGGNRGLGLEMSQALAEAGASIAVVGRDSERNAQSASLLASEYSAQTLPVECDVTQADAVSNAVGLVVAEFGRIDILINSAGINIRGPIEDVQPDDFDKVMQVNVNGAWLMCRAVTSVMKQRGYGRIVNVASMLSFVAIPERTPYATSKGAVLQLTRSLAIELAPSGVNVNALCPGPFATEMNLPLTNDPQKFAAFVAKIPLGRWGELHEIGGLALYLCSPSASYVTGGAFSIDGGWIAQ